VITFCAAIIDGHRTFLNVSLPRSRKRPNTWATLSMFGSVSSFLSSGMSFRALALSGPTPGRNETSESRLMLVIVNVVYM
jgi:hypothetical protein